MISLLSTRAYRNYPNRYYDAAVDSVLHLQKGCYDPRWELVPQSGEIVPARGKLTMQVRLLPGSYIYRIEGAGVYNLTDDSSGLMLFDQAQTFDGLLPRPFYSEKGALTLDFFNTGSTDEQPRLVLYVIEPKGDRS
ncbi:hypothetical protein J4558_25265 [Leptolyngbya sp. 15MV]|nr:hypothetical protein J4558_25265 [Leptolyngbya sp. 15MV]